MENEYKITISNKYSLFLSGDEDPMDKLQKLQLQAKPMTKKEKEKAKKNAGKSADVTQNNALPVERNIEKVDQFSSPIAEELPVKPIVQTEVQSGSTTRNRGASTRDRPRGHGRDGPYQDNRRPGGGRDIFQGVEMYEHAGDRRGGDRGGGQKDHGLSDRNSRPDGYRGGFRRYPPRYAAGQESQDNNRDGFSDQRGSRFNQSNSQSQGDGSRPEGVRNFNRPSSAGEGVGYGNRPPRRGGFRGGRRMDRGSRYPSDTHPADGITPEDGAHHPADRGGPEQRNAVRRFSGNEERRERGDGEHMEHSDGQENGFAVRRGQRGRRGRGFGGGYDRAAPRYRDYGEQRARHSETRLDVTSHDNTVQQSAEENKSPDVKPPAGMDSVGTPVGEDGATWAEQLEAADKAEETAAKRDEETPATPGTEESHEMTLDEWKAQRDAKRTKVDFNIRKPGEGEAGDPRWNKMYVLSKKETEKTEDVDEVEEEQEEEHHGTKPRNTLPIEIRFVDDSRRGGRGGGFAHAGTRGGRDRGGGGVDRFRSSDNYYQRDSQQIGAGPGRGDYRANRRPFIRGGRGGGTGRGIRHERTPNLDNEMDFPSLDKTTGPTQTSQQ